MMKTFINYNRRKTIEIAGESMVNSIEERRMNKTNQFHIKACRYPGAYPIDIIDNLKASLRKAPDEIMIHAGTNPITNNVNYLTNVKKILKLAR